MQITRQRSDEPTDPRRLLQAGLKNCAGLRLVWRRGGEYSSCVYTGFVLKIHEHWEWCSAGHCVKAIEQAAAGDDLARAILEVFSEDTTIETIDVRLKGVQMDWVDEDGGLDLGYIMLDEWYGDQLAANGAAPILPDEVCSPAVHTIGHVLIGLPAQYSKLEVLNGLGVAREAPVPVMLARDREREDEDMSKLRFSWTGPGIVTAAGSLESISGMSGGLIYALFTLPGEVVGLSPLAVQSSWDPKRRRLSASPLMALTVLLERAYTPA